MSFALSSVQSSFLSASYTSKSLTFINNEREATHALTSINISNVPVLYSLFTQNIKGLNFEDSYFTFVTNFSDLSSYIDTTRDMDGNTYGYAMKNHNSLYDWRKNNFTQSITAYNQTQYLGIVDHDFNFNILPLKTKVDINNDQYSMFLNCREYQKVYDINDSLFFPELIFPTHCNCACPDAVETAAPAFRSSARVCRSISTSPMTSR